MFIEKLQKKEKYKLMDLAFYMSNIEGPTPTEEERLISIMIAELGNDKEGYLFNDSPKRVDLSQTIKFFKDRNRKVKKIVFLNLLRISFNDGIYNTKEHFFLENIQNHFEISDEEKKKIVQIVYGLRDVYESGKRIISE